METLLKHDIELGKERVAELRKLKKYERIYEKASQSFKVAGEALLAIKQQNLHRLTHEDWPSYCEQRWGISERYANHLINAAKVDAVLRQADEIIGTVVPMIDNEAQARELAPLLDDPQGLLDLWHMATESERKPTAKEIKLLRDGPPHKAEPNERIINRIRASVTDLPGLLAQASKDGAWKSAGYESFEDFIRTEVGPLYKVLSDFDFHVD